MHVVANAKFEQKNGQGELRKIHQKLEKLVKLEINIHWLNLSILGNFVFSNCKLPDSKVKGY